MSNNPFPGLRPFKQEETRLFFGRDGQSQELLKRLQQSRFLALVGVSGSGKSSLIKAGLLPKLEGGLMSAVESDWRVAVFRPGNNPIGNMARALVTEAGLGGDSGFEDVEIAIAETTLRRGNLGLLELLREAKRKVREDGQPFLGENENVLVVVDQFEEIFRIIEQYDELVRVKQLSGNRSGAAATAVTDDLKCHPREEASAFVKLLLESTERNHENNYDENLYVIVTMRSDYLGDTAQFGGMPEKINEGQYLIPRMDRADRRKAIVGPIAVEGGSITESLINQLLNDAGEDPRRLPILQHALMRMWELAERGSQNGGLNLAHYEQIERLSGALSQHANEAFKDLSAKHQELAAKIFKSLTEKGLANREIRRPMKIADICAVVGAKEDDVKRVVDCFRKNGRWFLMPSADEKSELTSDTLIDISHESLISGWDKLRTWVNEEAESARTYKRLADTAILKDLGKEDFYRGPALQLALKWREDNAPNQAWARRYHPEYDKAIAFLDGSLKDTQKREQEEKDRAARDLRRTRTYNTILGILAVMFLSVGAVAVGLQRQMLKTQERLAVKEATEREAAQDREKEAIKLKNEAVLAKNEAVDARNETEKARKQAVDANEKLTKSLKKEQAAVTLAQEARASAIKERDKARRLQNENLEQATTYKLFKTAFDHVASREYEEALVSLQTALDYFGKKEGGAATDSEKTESKRNKISTIVNIGDVHRSKGDPQSDDLAIKTYEEALGMIAPNDKELLAPTLMKAGSIWRDSEDEDQALQAVAYYEKAANAYVSLSKQDSAKAWLEAGKIHLAFKDKAGFKNGSADFDRAMKLLEGNNAELAGTGAEIGESHTKLVAHLTTSADENEGASPESAAKPDYRDQDQLSTREVRENGAKAFRRSATAFEKAGDLKKAAEMRQNAGQILVGSRLDELINASAEDFLAASTLYGRAGDVKEQTTVLLKAGEILLARQRETANRMAIRLLDQAALINQSPAEHVVLLSRIGMIYADANEKELAFQYYDRAIDFARQHKEKEAELNAILDKVDALRAMKDENLQNKLDEIYSQVTRIYNGDATKQVESIVRFGRTVLGTSRDEASITQADKFFQDALNLAQTQADKKLVAPVSLEIGIAYGMSRRVKATESYQRALKIYEAEGDLLGQAKVLYRLGSLSGAGSSEFVDRSLAFFIQVLPTLEASGKQVELADAYYAMGSLYRRKKDYKAALDSYNLALPIYLRLPDQTLKMASTKNLIRTTQRLLGTD